MSEKTESHVAADQSQAPVSLFCRTLGVGCCICLNDVERPCAELLAVITKIEGDQIIAKYLNADSLLDNYRKKGCRTTPDLATPVGRFGVVVRVDADGMYWCDKICESEAKYPEGEPRQWQDRGYGVKYVGRHDVLAVAKSG